MYGEERGGFVVRMLANERAGRIITGFSTRHGASERAA